MDIFQYTAPNQPLKLPFRTPADSQGSVLNRVTFALREDTVLLDDNRHQNIPNFVGVKLPIVPAQGHTRTSGPLGHRRGCSAALHQQVGPVVGEGGHWSFSHLCGHVDPLCVSRARPWRAHHQIYSSWTLKFLTFSWFLTVLSQAASSSSPRCDKPCQSHSPAMEIVVEMQLPVTRPFSYTVLG